MRDITNNAKYNSNHSKYYAADERTCLHSSYPPFCARLNKLYGNSYRSKINLEKVLNLFKVGKNANAGGDVHVALVFLLFLGCP
jgi:hypothetical protein